MNWRYITLLILVSFINVTNVSAQAPSATLVDPPDSSFTACRTQTILIAVYHIDPIVPESLVLTVGSDIFAWGSPELRYANDTISLYPPVNYFSSGSVPLVLSPIFDNRGLSSPSYSWEFYVDTEKPIIENIRPSPGSSVAGSLFFDAYDCNLGSPHSSGVAYESIQVFVDNRTGTYDLSSDINRNGVTLSVDLLDPTIVYTPNENFTVRISIPDRVNSDHCGPNSIDTIITYRIAQSTNCRMSTNPITPNSDGYNDYTEFSFPGITDTDKDRVIYIYDVTHRLVKEIDAPGIHGFAWDGTDDNDNTVPQGVYYYIITVDDESICNGTSSVAR